MSNSLSAVGAPGYIVYRPFYQSASIGMELSNLNWVIVRCKIVTFHPCISIGITRQLQLVMLPNY